MSLFLELTVATMLIVAVTAIHGTGVAFSDKLFTYESRELRRQKLATRELELMIPMALCLFGLHFLEISLFAAFYLLFDTAETMRDALYHSALAYTTMGVSDSNATRWPLVTAFEGLAGFLLIGWSAAVFVTDMEKVLRRRS